MATLGDIGVAAGINILSALAFLIAFAIIRLQPVNDRVYFPKWYINGARESPSRESESLVSRYVNLDWRSYIKFLNWVPDALRMTESEIIDHAGLDSAVYLRIYLLGLKIFVPVGLLSWAILVPVNWTNDTLANSEKLEYSDIDKLSISNIPHGSPRLWAHLTMAYAVTIWACYTLQREYANVAEMRLHFLVSGRRRPNQFTVLVKNVPPDPDESVSESVEHFFLVNHPSQYLTHQTVVNANKLAKLVKEVEEIQNWLEYYKFRYSRNTAKRPTTRIGFLGLWGLKVDAIDYKTAELEIVTKEIEQERERVKKDPKCIMPAAFVSFKTTWSAAVCAQTQQSSNPTLWLTEWAPEPRDLYWQNLAIPYVSLTIRRLVVAVAFFFLTFFFMIPVTFVQSLANLEGLGKIAPFLKPIIDAKLIKSVMQGFLPGIALKIFLIMLPKILMAMSRFEGFISKSELERRAAMRLNTFNFVNIFLVSVMAGTALQQLDSFIHQAPNQIPITIGFAIPMKATFFITYVMVDGWAGVAAEVLRVKPLIFYHVKNLFLVKTEKDREEAMDPGSLEFNTGEPQIQLYFLLGLIYAVVTPFFTPFILVFFAFAYVVFRHQIINVYDQEYESAAAFWPDVNGGIIFSLVFSQIVLIGLLSSKGSAMSTPFLLCLLILTIWFHFFCKGRYEPAFRKYPLQEAMKKDTLERAKEPYFNLKKYLKDAYVHPVFKDEDEDEDDRGSMTVEENAIVPTKRNSRRFTPAPSVALESSHVCKPVEKRAAAAIEL